MMKIVIFKKMKTVVKLGTKWCSACKAMTPLFNDLKSEYSSQIELKDIDVDKDSDLAVQFNIRSIPTILFIEDDTLINKHTGVISKSALKTKIDDFIN